MSDSVSQWLEKSRATMVAMERDLQHHQREMDAAMATFRAHGEKIEALEKQLEIIGNALAAAEAAAARNEATQAPVKATPTPVESPMDVDTPTTVRRIEPPSIPQPSAKQALRRPEAPPLRAVDFS